MRGHITVAIKTVLVTMLLLGIAYPLAVTGIAQLALPRQANGSLVTRGDSVVGSSLIGQKFESDRYFHGRPSAGDYDPLSSGASNLAPTSLELAEQIRTRAGELRGEAGLAESKALPAEMVTASGSGLDPHISPEGAELQVRRVARARGLSPRTLREIVRRHTEERYLGLLGEPRVNVLELNLDLDGASTPAAR